MNSAEQLFPASDAALNHSVVRLEKVFSSCFFDRYNTLLEGGFDEPLYRPAIQDGQAHMLCYREDFFASALHEIAHWCIAGAARRKRVDFGYWYAPDGRSAAQQQAFERVEYKPQALEWFFSKACGCRFRISVDNLNGTVEATGGEGVFELQIIKQAEQWCAMGLPSDAGLFFSALCREFGVEDNLTTLYFSLDELK